MSRATASQPTTRSADGGSRRRSGRSQGPAAGAPLHRRRQRRAFRLAGTPQTLREAAEAFVEGIACAAIRTRAGERYKPSVVREYERSLRLHVLPALGGAKLAKIQRRDVQRLADELLVSGADPSTIRNALKPLQVIYRMAIEDGELAVNPCERLRLPAARGRRERIAAPAEAAVLIAALRPEDRALWGCPFYAGLRRGELRALLWSDVDVTGGLIRIERSMNSYGDATEPKSRAGRRGVPIIAALRDLLVEHKLAIRRDAGSSSARARRRHSLPRPYASAR